MYKCITSDNASGGFSDGPVTSSHCEYTILVTSSIDIGGF